MSNVYKINGTALRVPVVAADPVSPENGLIWYNSVSNTFKRYENGATTDLGGSPTFSDSTFRIQDNGDATKQIAFEASAITTGTTRTVTVPDTDVDLTDIATNAADIADLETLSGVAGDTDLGTFTGSTIPDDSTIKGALQALETEVETKASTSVVTEIDGNVNDLITLTGVAENETDLGTFTGSTIPDDSTIKGALQALETEVETKIDASEKGQADGVATLDGGGKVPVSQLPSAVMTYEGVWNATTNSPTLEDGTGDAGMVYRVGTAGTQDLGSGNITFSVGDYVIYNGTVWEKSDTTDAVASVFGRTGIVTAQSGDYTATQVTNTPAGGIAAITVQAAINELDTEKFNSADFNSSFDTQLATKDTDDLDEGANLYFTDGRAQTAAVVNSTAGSETVQAASVSAMKSYVAAQIATKDAASEITYSNATSGLTATDVQAAIDEVDAAVDGKVTGPASATDNTLPRYDGTTGKLIQGSAIAVDDSNNLSGFGVLVHGASGLQAGSSTTDFYETQYVHSTTLTASQTNAVASAFTFAHASFEGVFIEYKIKEATTNRVRIGHLYIATNGTDSSITDTFTETGDVGVTWNLNINGGNVEVRYTTGTNAKTMRAVVKRIKL